MNVNPENAWWLQRVDENLKQFFVGAGSFLRAMIVITAFLDPFLINATVFYYALVSANDVFMNNELANAYRTFLVFFYLACFSVPLITAISVNTYRRTKLHKAM